MTTCCSVAPATTSSTAAGPILQPGTPRAPWLYPDICCEGCRRTNGGLSSRVVSGLRPAPISSRQDGSDQRFRLTTRIDVWMARRPSQGNTAPRDCHNHRRSVLQAEFDPPPSPPLQYSRDPRKILPLFAPGPHAWWSGVRAIPRLFGPAGANLSNDRCPPTGAHSPAIFKSS